VPHEQVLLSKPIDEKKNHAKKYCSKFISQVRFLLNKKCN